MSIISVRDPNGGPITLMNMRISEGQKPQEEAIYDIFTDHAGNTGWPIPFWPSDGEFTLHFNYANINPRFKPLSVSKKDGEDMQVVLDFLEVPVIARRGLVRAEGRCAIDDDGLFHPLGLTFFWGLYGWRHERERVIEHFEWLKQFNFDYLRILAEVDWEGRSILPSWPDYENILRDFVDTAYDKYGMRCEVTLVGGQYSSHPGFEQKVKSALSGAEHKVMHYEVCNEWKRLNKISSSDMIKVCKYLRNNTPNLVALSASAPYSEIIDLSKQAGANMYTCHTRRSEHDFKWSHVRQGYDLKEFPAITSNNEPQGPQSSVNTLDDPMQLAMARATGIVCSGAMYVLHVGQGVTGVADPDHGRPQNMWEVPNINTIINHVRRVDEFLPQGIENWKVVNNGRSDHPLPLDPSVNKGWHSGFWEGSNGKGSTNKNYATISGNRFVEVLLGLRNPNTEGSTLAGKARLQSNIKAIDVRDYGVHDVIVPNGGDLHLRGLGNTMIGHILQGNL